MLLLPASMSNISNRLRSLRLRRSAAHTFLVAGSAGCGMPAEGGLAPGGPDRDARGLGRGRPCPAFSSGVLPLSPPSPSA